MQLLASSEPTLSNPPSPPFSKGGKGISPFEKGGLRGILLLQCFLQFPCIPVRQHRPVLTKINPVYLTMTALSYAAAHPSFKRHEYIPLKDSLCKELSNDKSVHNRRPHS